MKSSGLIARRHSINRAARCSETVSAPKLAPYRVAFAPLEADAPVCVSCRWEGSPRPAHGCADGRDRAEVSRGEYGERPRPRAWKRISEMAQRWAWQKSPNAICRKSAL